VESEVDLVESILRHARRRYGRSAVCALELRSHGRAKTDLVVYYSGQVIAIEAKLQQWRRVIVQAVLNTYYADESYVALCERYVSQHVIDEAARFQIGVIAVAGKKVRVVQPAGPLTPNRVLRTRMVEALLSRAQA
jgi:hypothetical protein